MAGYNGSGTFVRSYDWTDDRDDNIPITASRMDTEMDAVAVGLSNVICRDGQSTPSANIPMGGYKITGLGTPTSAADAVTKAYADALASGTRVTVAAATTANVNLSTDIDAGSTLDGATLSEGEVILLKDQTSADENGLYDVPAVLGTATRTGDYDTWDEIVGVLVAVDAGTTNGGTLWQNMNNSGGTLEVTDIAFAQAGSSLTTPVSLANGGTAASLTDPDADRIFFWDDSAGAGAFLAAVNGLSISDTSLSVNINGTADLAAPDRADELLISDASTANAIRKADLASIVDLAHPTESFIIACSDETTALTAGTAKVTFRMPYAFALTEVRGSLTTAQTSGSIFTVDINEGGTTILSTKLTIDNTEKTSTTAVAAPVISDASIADDASITIDIDQVGDGTAKGLKVTLIGTRT